MPKLQTFTGTLKIEGDASSVIYKDKKGKERVEPVPPETMTIDAAARKNGMKVIIERDPSCFAVVSCREWAASDENAAAPQQTPAAKASPQPVPVTAGHAAKTELRGSNGDTRSQGTAVTDATAPYNFIPYAPEAVGEGENEPGHWSGVISCRLDALTPFLVSRGSGAADTRKNGPAECHFFSLDGKYVIPGSSIKGMLRSLVETLTFSAMRMISGKKEVWRNVNARDDSFYKQMMRIGDKKISKFSYPVHGAYVRKNGADYEIAPVEVKPVPRVGDINKNWKRVPEAGGERVGTGGMRTPKKAKNRMSCDYLFSRPDPAGYVPLDREIFNAFTAQRTDARSNGQGNGWDERRLKDGVGHPVFYRRDESGAIAELGLCRYFRVQYEKSPEDLAMCPGYDDMATRMFGKVRGGAVRGRISVEPAWVDRAQETEFRPVVLGTPHPTCLSHYLVQENARARKESTDQNIPESLANYQAGSRLRGRKMYWHHDVHFPERPNDNDNVAVMLYPLQAGATASVRIHVDRLTDLELGALLEALSLPEGHAYKLGMGKPLGLGSVTMRITECSVHDIRERYASLSSRLAGNRMEVLSEEKRKALREAFKAHVLNEVGSRYAPWKTGNYEELPPIQALRIMMDWTHRPSWEKVQYMSLLDFKRKAILLPPENVRQR